jgi:hypothetical protein
MFCPRCSQQQFPDEARFCSRCGLQLGAVSQLLNNDGMPLMNANYPKQRLPLIKRQELRKGAKLMFLSIFSVVPFFILAVSIDHGLPLIVPFLAFLVGLAQVLYYFFFGESILPVKNQSFESSENSHQFNFQPAPGLPFSVVDSKPFNTAEFRQPFSAGRSTEFLNNK